LIKIENFTAGTFENMIMQEKLVRVDKECLLMVNDFLMQFYKQSSVGETKLVCFGGDETFSKTSVAVKEVFNSSKNTKSASN